MKRILFILTVFISSFVFGQTNLVPNGDLEYYTLCPSDPPGVGMSQVYKAYPWYNPTLNTSDYFNVCCSCPTPTGVGVPTNFWGSQPARSGNGYCGFWAYGGWANPYGRDYIAVRLIDSLKQNKKYCVSFYVSLNGPSIYGIDAIGMYFSKDSVYDYSTSSWLPYIPQVINQGNIIMDTLNWVIIQGTYLAQGGEIFIVIGNFFDNANTNADSTTTTLQPGSSYYYIDDVSIYECDTVTATPTPTESAFFLPNAFSPNGDGENDLFFVRGDLEELHCEIFNRWGEKVTELTEPNESWDGTFSGQKCNTGVYVYVLTAKDKEGKEITKQGNVTLLR